MPKPDTATCNVCGWHGPSEHTKELRDVWDRVPPGYVMPAGECPVDGCPGCAMLDHPDGTPQDLRPPLTGIMLGLISGKLQTTKWQDQSGNDRYTTEILIVPGGRVQFMDKLADAPATADPAMPANDTGAPAPVVGDVAA